jgi:hypothetical protein
VFPVITPIAGNKALIAFTQNTNGKDQVHFRIINLESIRKKTIAFNY